MKKLRIVVLVALALTLIVMPGLALAQGLDQMLEWPETGFSMAYPAGWIEVAPDSETRVLLSNPNDDVLNGTPTAPAVIVIGFPVEFLDVMGSPEQLLQTFIGELAGNAAVPVTPFTVAGYEGVRANIPDTGEGFGIDVVLISSETNVFLIFGAAPVGQLDGFRPTFDAMLNTVVLSEPATVSAPPAIETPVTGVRITLDESLTGNWNEIDAVELIGMDADGVELSQWAISAEATSQYADDSWSASQATGTPDTAECGDYGTAWASDSPDGPETLTLQYGMPMIPTAVNIYETYNPGAIVRVELLPADPAAEPIVIFEGVDTTVECPGVFSIPITAGGGSIAYGETVSGVITDDAYAQDWTFQGNAGDVVTITMIDISTGDTLDPYLYLLGPDGSEIASNDDAEADIGLFNSQIVGVTLPVSGTYTIRATRFGEDFGSSTGEYTLTLEMGSTSSVSVGGAGAIVPMGAISYGQTVNGMITDAAYAQDWTFQGNAGDVVSITMVDVSANGGLDPFVYLLGPDGSEIASNDDADFSTLDSQILGITLPASGTYTIRATRFGEDFGGSTGEYQLTLDMGSTSSVSVGGAGASVPMGAISYGQTVNGVITDDSYAQDWTFQGNAGDVVTITMIDTSADNTLDPFLYLLGPDGSEIASNDDAEADIGLFNSQIVGVTLPASGTYTIRATRFGENFGSSTGEYTLTLESGAGAGSSK